MAALEQLRKLHAYTLRRLDFEQDFKLKQEAKRQETEARKAALAQVKQASLDATVPAGPPAALSVWSRSTRSSSSGSLSLGREEAAPRMNMLSRSQSAGAVAELWNPSKVVHYPVNGWWNQKEIRRKGGKRPWWIDP
eukprot:TRINITY_DN28568_c0_g1_i1.p2 TRINITY_DN28568_c0_g1~~TRINITY_DN28568_c0_g1_i1.p2  ORF type:complete len:137 (-),score=38.80 TRINITY_DN28568_c0_g1_i1:130-540(-)